MTHILYSPNSNVPIVCRRKNWKNCPEHKHLKTKRARKRWWMSDILFKDSLNSIGENIMTTSNESISSHEHYDYVLGEQIPDFMSEIDESLSNMTKIWDGIESGEKMLSAGDRNWQQIEWIGWFFEFWAKENLKKYFDFHEGIDEKNRSVFDAHNEFPWEFKTHVKYNAAGAQNKEVPLNDKEAIDNALTKYGKMGIIIVNGKAEFGDKYESWRMSKKGSPSKAQLRNLKEGRKSRKRKDSFEIINVSLYIINSSDMEELINKKIVTIFKQGRQADGSPRKTKYKINTSRVKPSSTIFY